MDPLAFVDVETTGLHPDRHEIWEVGLILPQTRTVKHPDGPDTLEDREYSWLLPVEHLADADPIALDIGRFHDRHPQGNRWRSPSPAGAHTTPLQSFAEEFAQLTHGRHLVGAVISFDEERLRRLLWKCGRQPGWHYHLVDIEAMAAGWVAREVQVTGQVVPGRPAESGYGRNHIDGRPPWDSNDLSHAVEIDPDSFDRHTALGDCRWARAIYQKVMAR